MIEAVTATSSKVGQGPDSDMHSRRGGAGVCGWSLMGEKILDDVINHDLVP